MNNSEAKKTAERLLKEMNLQRVSIEYASAIIALCDYVEDEPDAEKAYCYGFLMGCQRSKPFSTVKVMSENLKPDWIAFKNGQNK